MHRIDTPTAMIDKFGQGKNGFTNGDTTTGRRATQLTDSYWDAIQEEVCTAIESAGIVLDKTKHNQLYLAIQKAIDDKGFLRKDNNLSDLPDKAASRSSLELGSSALKNAEFFVPATRKVNNKLLNDDITLNAGDVGAISVQGGNYNAILRMLGIETLATEPAAANLSALYSAPSPIQPGTIASGTVHNWYSNQIMTGLIRNASTGVTGWGVTFNGVVKFIVDPSGNVYAAGTNKLATESYAAQQASQAQQNAQSYAAQQASQAQQNAQNYTNQNFVQDVRLGSETTAPVSNHDTGFVLTAFDAVGGGASTLYRRPIQKLINSTWMTVGAI